MKMAALLVMLCVLLNCATIQPRVVCSWFSEHDLQLKAGKNITIAVVGERGIPYAATTVIVESIDGKEKQERVTSLDGKAVFNLIGNHNVIKVKFRTWCQNQYYRVEDISLNAYENSVVLIVKIPDDFCQEGFVE